MWETVEPEPVRPPALVAYHLHCAIAWLVSGYLFVAIHALLGRALPARWLGGKLWALGPNLGGVDASRLALPGTAGKTALLGLTSIALTLLVSLLLGRLGRRAESFLARLWLTMLAYSTALGLTVSLLTDCLAPVPGGDARLLAAGLGALWRPLGHAWLLTPFALLLLLAQIAVFGRGLVLLASHLHAPGSDGFGSWALAPIGPGLAVRILWLGWAGWRLPQRAGLWTEMLIWMVTLAALSLVAYNWSRRRRRVPPPARADTTGLYYFISAGLVALIGLLVAFGFGPATDRVWILAEAPATELQSAATVAGNLALEVDKSGKVRFTLDLALIPGNDPLAARLASSMEKPDAVPAFWQSSAEALLRQALPGMGLQDVKATKTQGNMWVGGGPDMAARRFSGTLTTPATSLSVALPVDGTVRLDDLAISSAAAVTIVGLDAARQPVIKLPVASGAVYHYSRNRQGGYFLPGADTPPVRLAFFSIQST